jgi:hypothetical protein
MDVLNHLMQLFFQVLTIAMGTIIKAMAEEEDFIIMGSDIIMEDLNIIMGEDSGLGVIMVVVIMAVTIIEPSDLFVELISFKLFYFLHL